MRLETAVDYLARGEMRRYETLVRLTSGAAAVLFGNKKTTQQMQEALGMRRQSTPLPTADSHRLPSSHLQKTLTLRQPPRRNNCGTDRTNNPYAIEIPAAAANALLLAEVSRGPLPTA